jgi:2,3-bisphosphoglycerate-independent phosphoglycerate mutase
MRTALACSDNLEMKPFANMKTFWCGLTAILLLAVSTLSGCSKKVTVDTVKLEYSFQTSDATNQAAVTEAVEAIDKADFTSARAKLQKVAADPKLTGEQKTSVNDVIQQLDKH